MTLQHLDVLWQEKEVGKLLGRRQVWFKEYCQIMHVYISHGAKASCLLMQILQ